jgi:hypothetical protein
VLAFEHGTLTVKLYAPRGTDQQAPHAHDEAYVVVSGSGTFVHGERRDPFVAGDFLFAPRSAASLRELHRRSRGVGDFLQAGGWGTKFYVM